LATKPNNFPSQSPNSSVKMRLRSSLSMPENIFFICLNLMPLFAVRVPSLPTSSRCPSSLISKSRDGPVAEAQLGRRRPGVGDGAGVGGDAGADGSRLPGITFGFDGMGMGRLVEEDDNERAEGRETEVGGCL
jgi:hypothetical protein